MKIFETFKEKLERLDEAKVSKHFKTHFEVVIALINYMETEEGISIDEPVKTKDGFIYYDSEGEETEVIVKGKKADIVGGAKNITIDQFANFLTDGEPEILLDSDNINEGKEWYDYTPEKLAKKFMKDNKNKNATGEDLDSWLDMFAYDKDIEDDIAEWQAEEIVEYLNKKGYKNMTLDGVRVSNF